MRWAIDDDEIGGILALIVTSQIQSDCPALGCDMPPSPGDQFMWNSQATRITRRASLSEAGGIVESFAGEACLFTCRRGEGWPSVGHKLFAAFYQANVPHTLRLKRNAAACRFNWAILSLSFSMLSTVELSLGQMAPPPHSCPGWGGEGRHPLRNWPLTTSAVLQMSRLGLTNPQTSLVATTLVLAQTSTLLGLQMTSVGRWQKHSLYVLERSVCDRMTLLLTPALFVVFSFFFFIYRILGSSMNHLCGRVFDEKEMCFEMLQL